MAAASSADQNTFGWRDAALGLTSVLLLVTGWLYYATIERLEQRIDANKKLTDERCQVVSERLVKIEQHDQRVEAKVDGALITIGTAVAKLDAHNIEAEAWKSEIRANRREITDLRTNANARQDPYTGTNARERAAVVDELIRSLDRRIDALEAEAARNGNGNGKVKR